jgi:hypothetical protein
MFFAYGILLIASQIIGVILRIAGFRHYLIVGLLLFVVSAVALTLMVRYGIVNEPFLPSPEYHTSPDTGN